MKSYERKHLRMFLFHQKKNDWLLLNGPFFRTTRNEISLHFAGNLIWFNSFILRWYCTIAEANKNQPLIAINMAKIIFLFMNYLQNLFYGELKFHFGCHVNTLLIKISRLISSDGTKLKVNNNNVVMKVFNYVF